MSGSNGQHAVRAAQLPAGWASASIGSVVAPMETANPANSGPGEFLYVDIDAVDNITNRITSPKRLPRASPPSRARHVIRTNDVIISLVRPRLKNIAIVPQELDAQWASTAFCVCRPRVGVDARYLHYMFVQDEFLQAIKTYGDSPPSGHDDDLFNTIVPVAPLAEQTRIADRIDELFTDLAAGVAALERVKRNLSRYRAAVLHAAVTGRLTEAWRKQHEPPDETGPKLLERILAERRRQWERRTLAKYEKAGKQLPKGWRDRYPEPSPPKLPSDGSALPELPKGWCWASLDQAGHLQRGRSRHRPRDAAHLYGGPYPFIQTGDIRKANLIVRSHTQTYSEAGLAQSQLWPAGTLCITIAANIAETAILGFEACFPDSVVGYHGVTPFVGTEYVMYFVKSVRDQLDRFAPATAQKNINDEILSQVPMPVPPLAEQSAIVESVSEKLSQIDGLEGEIERGLARASRLRQSILKTAFEGKLVPQDPADEPASELLERTKQQASEPAPKSNGDGHFVNGTVSRRRGRPVGSRKAAPDAATTLTASTPAKAKRSRKVRKQ
jgi:type I restriction enzyme, S subunit